MKLIGRRQFLKTSLSGFALATLPGISFSQSNPDVVVIGAGAAGLSAAAHLISKGKSVLCIEAMNRIGGRCYTDTSTFGVPADLGAHWLHAQSGNELKKFGIKHSDKFKIYKQPSAYAVYNGRSKDKTNTLWDLSDKIDKVYERQTDQPLLDLLPDKLKKIVGLILLMQ